jgi:hypothetical protein
MINHEEDCVVCFLKVKEASVVAGYTKRKSTAQVAHFFNVEARIAPIIQESLLLLYIQSPNIRGQPLK